ncbi:MAG: restriction endonuclease subunit S, partial [Muribaculaceae bacterium]|nr:restriction endonuclease subunit S [Muribaculaceae bacterium]
NENDWILELEDIEKDSGLILEKKRKGDREVKGVRHTFQSGVILYSKLRTYLNKVVIAPNSGYCSTEIIPIKCHDSITPQYLCAWLRSSYFLAYTQSCGYGVKMPRLSTSDARNGIVPLPPLNEQRRIMERVYSIFGVLDSIANSVN